MHHLFLILGSRCLDGSNALLEADDLRLQPAELLFLRGRLGIGLPHLLLHDFQSALTLRGLLLRQTQAGLKGSEFSCFAVRCLQRSLELSAQLLKLLLLLPSLRHGGLLRLGEAALQLLGLVRLALQLLHLAVDLLLCRPHLSELALRLLAASRLVS